MPTSAPGHSKNRGQSPISGGGFTLIELLVVLLVMGLLAGLIGTLVRPDERGVLRMEAERLAQLLELAATESRLTGNPVAFTAARSNYSFWHWRDNAGWLEAREDVLRARSLPSGMTMSERRIEFDPYVPAVYELQMSLGESRYAIGGSPLGEVRIHASP